MSAQSDRRWAELARELEFSQLQELRKQAEGWRAGLTALTGLLAALAVLKGRENLADLPAAARYAAMVLTAVAFLLFVSGSVLAVRASHGRPGSEILLGGQALRRWTEREVVRVRRSLSIASVCCLAGVAAIVSGIAVAWLNTAPPSPNLVKVTTNGTTSCGELVNVGPSEISFWSHAQNTRSLTTVQLSTVSAVTPTRSC
jgi:hypothetical protein